MASSRFSNFRPQHRLDSTAPGAMLHRMMNYLFYELNHNDSNVLKNSGLRKSYDDMLLTALLSLPHNQREKLCENRRYQELHLDFVRRAEEYMKAHLDRGRFQLSDLLQICGCSRRALFSAFPQRTRLHTDGVFNRAKAAKRSEETA